MVQANNAIYNTVGASISGVTNTLTVTNLSNTASSAARETIVVGGGTAGDPTLNWNVSGVTNWEMGIDNSVSDNLTISQGTALGTNDTWRMTTGGTRTLPLQPVFDVYLSATQVNVTGDGTRYTVIYDTVTLNRGTVYNTGTGIFTAPVTGIYYISATAYSGGGSGGGFNQTDGSFIGTGTTLGFVATTCNLTNCASNAGAFVYGGSHIFSMTAGDTLKFTVAISGGTKTCAVYGGSPFAGTLFTKFSGALIC